MNRGKETTETLITTDDTEKKILSYCSNFSGNQYISGKIRHESSRKTFM